MNRLQHIILFTMITGCLSTQSTDLDYRQFPDIPLEISSPETLQRQFPSAYAPTSFQTPAIPASIYIPAHQPVQASSKMVGTDETEAQQFARESQHLISADELSDPHFAQYAYGAQGSAKNVGMQQKTASTKKTKAKCFCEKCQVWVQNIGAHEKTIKHGGVGAGTKRPRSSEGSGTQRQSKIARRARHSDAAATATALNPDKNGN